MTRKPTLSELALWAALPMAHTTHIEGRLQMILDTTRSRRALSRRALFLVLGAGATALVPLAMLRPAARAQAVPAKPRPTSPLPPTVTVTRYFISPIASYRLMKKEGRGSPIVWGQPRPAFLPAATSFPVKPKATLSPLKPVSAAPPQPGLRVAQLPPPPSTDVPPAPPPSTRPVPTPASPVLPMPAAIPAPPPPAGGAPINLVGVTDGSGKWWDASGTLLPHSLYDLAGYHRDDYFERAVTANKSRLDFAFRVLPSDAKDVTVRFSLDDPHAAWSSTLGTWPEKMQGSDRQTEAQLNAATGGLRVFTMTYTATPVSHRLVVHVASGPWTVAATGNVSSIGPASVFGEHAYLFGPLFETDGKGRVTISTNNTEDDIRVVAVDMQGHETLPLTIGDNSAGNMSQVDARFALPMSQIKKIRVEVRPFRQVEFKDVALQPAK